MTLPEQSDSALVEDHSHGPVIMLSIDIEGAGYVYVDGDRGNEERRPGIEVARSDGDVVQMVSRAEVDALIGALRCARDEVWPGDSRS